MEKNIRRKCVGCGELKPRENMIKITKEHKTGELVLNPNSKIFGRSAYLCYDQNCIEQAMKKKKINRILKTNLNIDLEGLINEQFKG